MGHKIEIHQTKEGQPKTSCHTCHQAIIRHRWFSNIVWRRERKIFLEQHHVAPATSSMEQGRLFE